MGWGGELFMRSRGCYFCVYDMNKHYNSSTHEWGHLTHTVQVLPMTSYSIVQCFMGYGSCKASTRKVISNSFYIDFIHGDTHDQSCKKCSFYNFVITVYAKKHAHGSFFAVLCCGYTLTDIPISIRLTSLALWQSNDCPSASKATLMNMDKYFMWIHYERLHNHNKAKHNKTVCIFIGIYCTYSRLIKINPYMIRVSCRLIQYNRSIAHKVRNLSCFVEVC